MADDGEALPPWFHYVQSEFEKQNLVFAEQQQQTQRALREAVDLLATKDSLEAERRFQAKEAELAADRLKRVEDRFMEQLAGERKAREDLATTVAERETERRNDKRFLWTAIITITAALIAATATVLSILLPHVSGG